MNSLLGAVLYVWLRLVATSATSTPPNIIFMLVDDLPWNAGGFGEYGSSSDMDSMTPNLNGYVDAGVKFSNYYAQETCTPSRAALMTGRYPVNTGTQYGSVDTEVPWGLPLDETLLPEVLKAKSSYTTYQVGKWHLGHFQPKMLPTARGFDYALSYYSSSVTYWSKFHLDTDIFSDDTKEENHFLDLTYSDNTCFAAYDGDDVHDYSTNLYRDKAINIVKNHDYDTTSLFLYLAFQAVHDPYEDIDYPNGIPKTMLGTKTYKKVLKKVAGRLRRQMAMSLYLVDAAVESVVKAVKKTGQSHNTYFIFASDNGGCFHSGGRNGPLRGNKGTLFEGGSKVNAILWGGKLSSSMEGTTYGGVFHVSDWFPTILDMAGISSSGYTSTKTLDGVSHWSYLKALTTSSSSTATNDGPRTYMLYNYYTNVEDKTWTSPIRAIRNRRYKLVQTMSGKANAYDDWDSASEVEDNDDDMTGTGTCTQGTATNTGKYTSFLFDLVSDPYEITNLYSEGAYASIISTLETQLATYANSSTQDVEYALPTNKACYVAWKKADNTIVPWIKHQKAGEGYPTWNKHGCDYSLLSPLYKDDDKADDDDFKYIDDDTFIDTSPTMQPTTKPSSKPTTKPSSKPNSKLRRASL